DAIGAGIGRGHGDVDEFARQRVERPGRGHHRLHLAPCALEIVRVAGEGAPEIVDVVGLAGAANVVEHRTHPVSGLLVRHETGGHQPNWPWSEGSASGRGAAAICWRSSFWRGL